MAQDRHADKKSAAIDVAMVEYLTNPGDVLALAKKHRVHVVEPDGSVSIVIYPGTIADLGTPSAGVSINAELADELKNSTIGDGGNGYCILCARVGGHQPYCVIHRAATALLASGTPSAIKGRSEPKQRLDGCQHSLERMIEWIDSGACPICATATAGELREKLTHSPTCEDIIGCRQGQPCLRESGIVPALGEPTDEQLDKLFYVYRSYVMDKAPAPDLKTLYQRQRAAWDAVFNNQPSPDRKGPV